MLKKNKLHGTFLFRLKNNAIGWILLLPVVFAIFICKWSPIYEGIHNSFYATQGYNITEFVGLKNYKDVLSDTLFMQTLMNTVMYVIWSLIIGFIPPILLAVLLNEVRCINKTFRVLTYLPNLAPAIVISLIWVNMYNPGSYGLLNFIISKMGVPTQEWLQNSKMTIPLIITAMTWSGTPSSAIIYLAALQGINSDLYEAAMIDGASIWKRFIHITFPSIAGVVLLQTARQIIAVFQIMQEPLVMTGGGPNNASMSINLSAFNYAFTYMKVSRSLALSTCAFLMMVGITIIYFRLEKKIKG